MRQALPQIESRRHLLSEDGIPALRQYALFMRLAGYNGNTALVDEWQLYSSVSARIETSAADRAVSRSRHWSWQTAVMTTTSVLVARNRCAIASMQYR